MATRTRRKTSSSAPSSIKRPRSNRKKRISTKSRRSATKTTSIKFKPPTQKKTGFKTRKTRMKRPISRSREPEKAPVKLFDRYMLQMNRQLTQMESVSLGSTIKPMVVKRERPKKPIYPASSDFVRSGHAELVVNKANISRFNAKKIRQKKKSVTREYTPRKPSLAKSYRHIRENGAMSIEMSTEMISGDHSHATQRAFSAYQAQLRANEYKSKFGKKVAYHRSLKKKSMKSPQKKRMSYRSAKISHRKPVHTVKKVTARVSSRKKARPSRKKSRKPKKTIPNGPRLIKPNQVTIKDLKIRALLGEGAFSSVYLGQWRSDAKNVQLNVSPSLHEKNMAIKVMRRKKTRKATHELIAEQLILSRLDHPFFPAYHGYFLDKKRIFLVLEFVIGGEILYHFEQSQTGCFEIPVARFYIAELICALAYLHSKGFVYRDLKPENVLLDREGHLKLVDFGFCKSIGQNGCDTNGYDQNRLYKTHTLCGSKEYVAPEVLEGNGHSFPVDMWSLGVLTYELICGHLPFDTQEASPFQVLDIVRETLAPGKNLSGWFGERITSGLNFPDFVKDRPTRDFINELLVMDPSHRLGSKRGWDDLKTHSFFTQVKWDWDACNARQLNPPIQPVFKDENDVSNYETAKFDHETTEKSYEEAF